MYICCFLSQQLVFVATCLFFYLMFFSYNACVYFFEIFKSYLDVTIPLMCPILSGWIGFVKKLFTFTYNCIYISMIRTRISYKRGFGFSFIYIVIYRNQWYDYSHKMNRGKWSDTECKYITINTLYIHM